MKVTIGDYPKNEKRKRLIKIQIDNWDLYSANHTLALIITPLLKSFKETNCTYPGSITSIEWDEILNQIIWTMEQIALDYEINLSTDPEYHQKIEKGCKLLGTWFQDLWS